MAQNPYCTGFFNSVGRVWNVEPTWKAVLLLPTVPGYTLGASMLLQAQGYHRPGQDLAQNVVGLLYWITQNMARGQKIINIDPNARVSVHNSIMVVPVILIH